MGEVKAKSQAVKLNTPAVAPSAMIPSMVPELFIALTREFLLVAKRFNQADGCEERRALLRSMNLLINQVRAMTDDSERYLIEAKQAFARGELRRASLIAMAKPSVRPQRSRLK